MKIVSKLRLRILPGKANAMPPIGPALGQKNINIMRFCKQFNEQSKSFNSSLKLRVLIHIYSDKSYNFIISQPSTTDLIKKTLSIKKGAVNPSREKCNVISAAQILNIAKIKILDMNTINLPKVIKIIQGVALSLGLYILK